jgi:Ammonium Transporter Family
MTTSNLFQQCSEAVSSAASTSSVNSSTNDTTVAMLACIADQLQREVVAKEALINEVTRSVLLVLCGALVFIMQAGFAMLCAGCVRKKNIQNTMLKNLLDACGAALAFFVFGFAFAFGGTYDVNNPMKTFVGTSHFFLFGYDDYAFWFFQYSFSAASTTIVAGAIAERCQMSAYLCYSMLLSGWVYPIIVRSIWSPQGFLSAYNAEPLWDTGVVDFAGASVVHITGGLTALFACIILGPRRGRFHDDEGVLLEEPRHFRGSSDALQVRLRCRHLLHYMLMHVQDAKDLHLCRSLINHEFVPYLPEIGFNRFMSFYFPVFIA